MCKLFKVYFSRLLARVLQSLLDKLFPQFLCDWNETKICYGQRWRLFLCLLFISLQSHLTHNTTLTAKRYMWIIKIINRYFSAIIIPSSRWWGTKGFGIVVRGIINGFGMAKDIRHANGKPVAISLIFILAIWLHTRKIGLNHSDDVKKFFI